MGNKGSKAGKDEMSQAQRDALAISGKLPTRFHLQKELMIKIGNKELHDHSLFTSLDVKSVTFVTGFPKGKKDCKKMLIVKVRTIDDETQEVRTLELDAEDKKIQIRFNRDDNTIDMLWHEKERRNSHLETCQMKACFDTGELRHKKMQITLPDKLEFTLTEHKTTDDNVVTTQKNMTAKECKDFIFTKLQQFGQQLKRRTLEPHDFGQTEAQTVTHDTTTRTRSSSVETEPDSEGSYGIPEVNNISTSTNQINAPESESDENLEATDALIAYKEEMRKKFKDIHAENTQDDEESLNDLAPPPKPKMNQFGDNICGDEEYKRDYNFKELNGQLRLRFERNQGGTDDEDNSSNSSTALYDVPSDASSVSNRTRRLAASDSIENVFAMLWVLPLLVIFVFWFKRYIVTKNNDNDIVEDNVNEKYDDLHNIV